MYNGYEKAQRQRQYETTMRAQRAGVRQLKAGGASAEDIQAAQARYLNTLHEYQTFSRSMGLPEQMERVYMDGLGRMAGGRISTKAVVKSVKFDIMKLTYKEQAALNQYFSFDFYPINEKIRRGERLTPFEQEMVRNLDSALKKFPRYKGNLSRSVHFDNEALTKEYVGRFHMGEIIKEEQFISTKCTPGLYNDGAEIQIFIENAMKGRDLSFLNSAEGEILYERGSGFKTKNIIEWNKKFYIFLEEA